MDNIGVVPRMDGVNYEVRRSRNIVEIVGVIRAREMSQEADHQKEYLE